MIKKFHKNYMKKFIYKDCVQIDLFMVIFLFHVSRIFEIFKNILKILGKILYFNITLNFWISFRNSKFL